MADDDSAVVADFPAVGHDHARCLAGALATAEALCRRRGLRLTELRRQVLALIWAEHRPVKAYELLERLREQRSGVAPPTVYRALDFLRQEGLIHRVESMSAYIGCSDPERQHPVQLLVCRRCAAVAELADREIEDVLQGKAQALGFQVDVATVELEGICPQCRG